MFQYLGEKIRCPISMFVCLPELGCNADTVTREQCRHCSLWASWQSHLVHPLAVGHIWCWADINHVTDDAGHQQTRLLMLAISRWLRMWGAAVRRISRRYYVTAERRSRPEWVGVWYRLCTQVSHVHCSPSQTAFTATVTRRHIGQHGVRVGQTMHIADNYLNNCQLLPERPRIDGQSATECRHAVHHTQIARALILCRIWHLAVMVSLTTPPAKWHPHRQPTWRSAAWLVIQGSWHGSDFNVIARCLLFFYELDIGDFPTLIRQCSSMLLCWWFLMSDVYFGWIIGRIVTRWMFGVMFNYSFARNSLLSMWVREFWKKFSIWQR